MNIELVKMIDQVKIEDVKTILGLDSKRSTHNALIKEKNEFVNQNGFEYATAKNKNVLIVKSTKEIVYSF